MLKQLFKKYYTDIEKTVTDTEKPYRAKYTQIKTIERDKKVVVEFLNRDDI